MIPAHRARRFATLAFILFVLFFGQTDIAYAQSASGPVIFDVRRSLPLEPDEEVTKDFYINAGPEAGFKKGVYISVVRPVPVHDPIKNMQQATLNIPVGKLKVIDVQRGITVARLEMELTDDERPTLEFEGIMVGDRIELGSMTVEQPKKPKPKLKRHVAGASSVAGDEPAPGSAEAMASRNVSLQTLTKEALTKEASVQPAPAPLASPAIDTSKPVEMSTAADVKTDAKTEPSSAPSSAATNNSSAPRAPLESAPKKSQAPKSARNSYPVKASADSVPVADDANFKDAGS